MQIFIKKILSMKKRISLQERKERMERNIISSFNRVNDKIQNPTSLNEDEYSDVEFSNKMTQQSDILSKANEMLSQKPIEVTMPSGQVGSITKVNDIRIPTHNWSEGAGPWIDLGGYTISVDNSGVKSDFREYTKINKDGFYTILGIASLMIKNSDNFSDVEKEKLMNHVVDYFKNLISDDLAEYDDYDIVYQPSDSNDDVGEFRPDMQYTSGNEYYDEQRNIDLMTMVPQDFKIEYGVSDEEYQQERERAAVHYNKIHRKDWWDKLGRR